MEISSLHSSNGCGVRSFLSAGVSHEDGDRMFNELRGVLLEGKEKEDDMERDWWKHGLNDHK